MCDEDGLCGLDDDYTFVSLLENVSSPFNKKQVRKGTYLSAVNTSTLGLESHVFHTCYMETIAEQFGGVLQACDDILQLGWGHLNPVNLNDSTR
jgi:hypothetical protein